MNIQELIDDFSTCDNQGELEDYINTNLKEIRLFFYNKNLIELTEIHQEFENLFFEFKSCPGFKEFEESGLPATDVLGSMLVFFASIFERINPNPIFTLLDILPNGSVNHRLKAYLCAYEDVNDIRTHYTKNLIKILDFLAAAQYDDEEDYTALVVSFLVKLYKHVVIKLTGLNLTDEVRLFTSLFHDTNLTGKYHFLTHPLITQLLDGDFESAETLFISESKTVLYYPSSQMSAIFKSEIVDLVKSHSDTRFNEVLLGYTAETVRHDIIEYGRADFTSGYGKLNSAEKVLLYCYFNMRKHFFTSSYVFEKIYESLHTVFVDDRKTAVFIDLGCGPLTSGLALADLHHEKTGDLLRVNYIGVDISEAMVDKAKSFLEYEIFSNDSLHEFALDWNLIPKSVLKKFIGLDNPIVINASYLFASSTLDQLSLANFVKGLVTKYNTSKIYFTYQNPNRTDRNQKYLDFKSELIYATHETNVERVFYKNNPSTSNEPSAEDVYFEILELN